MNELHSKGIAVDSHFGPSAATFAPNIFSTTPITSIVSSASTFEQSTHTFLQTIATTSTTSNQLHSTTFPVTSTLATSQFPRVPSIQELSTANILSTDYISSSTALYNVSTTDASPIFLQNSSTMASQSGKSTKENLMVHTLIFGDPNYY